MSETKKTKWIAKRSVVRTTNAQRVYGETKWDSEHQSYKDEWSYIIGDQVVSEDFAKPLYSSTDKVPENIVALQVTTFEKVD